ncbi:hypothetical protein HDU82_001348 [Entophlyctis luteolus]|nr:hypothetical protein HDU82_001348 [Entophlyctis luteolus]
MSQSHASARHQELRHHHPQPDSSDAVLASLIAALSTSRDYAPTPPPASTPPSSVAATPSRLFHASPITSSDHRTQSSEASMLKALSELSLDASAVACGGATSDEQDSQGNFAGAASIESRMAQNATSLGQAGGNILETLKTGLGALSVCENGGAEHASKTHSSSRDPTLFLLRPAAASSVRMSAHRPASLAVVRVQRLHFLDGRHAFTASPPLHPPHWRDCVPRSVCQVGKASLVLNDGWDPSARSRRRHPYYRPWEAPHNHVREVEMEDAYEDASAAVVHERGVAVRGRIF